MAAVGGFRAADPATRTEIDEDCGHAHAPDPRTLGEGFSWRAALATVVAAGARPCSGALLILVFALAQGLFSAGVAAVVCGVAGHGDHHGRAGVPGRVRQGRSRCVSRAGEDSRVALSRRAPSNSPQRLPCWLSASRFTSRRPAARDGAHVGVSIETPHDFLARYRRLRLEGACSCDRGRGGGFPHCAGGARRWRRFRRHRDGPARRRMARARGAARSEHRAEKGTQGAAESGEKGGQDGGDAGRPHFRSRLQGRSASFGRQSARGRDRRGAERRTARRRRGRAAARKPRRHGDRLWFGGGAAATPARGAGAADGVRSIRSRRAAAT